jgi:signal peptidase I
MSDVSNLFSFARSEDAAKETEPSPSPKDNKPKKEPETTKRKTLLFLRDTVIVVGTALLVSWLVTSFVVRAFVIPSGSMENTLQINNRILVSMMYPQVGGVHRGDVVVFKDPGGWLPQSESNDGYLIKRVIGLPGDKVSCCNEFGQVEVNGVGVNETYVKPGSAPSNIEFDVTVPEGHIWVMGDNRSNSKDSRYQTNSENGSFVPIDDIVGQAVMVTWPISEFKWISGDANIIFPKD